MFQKTYSRKQANVIYRAYKEGNIKLTSNDIATLYDNVGGIEVYDNTSLESAQTRARMVRTAVKNIFDGDYRGAQYMMRDFWLI